MKVTEYIQKANGRTLFSFEILPPLKGQSIEMLFQGIDPLMDFKPAFIDVTYHREEYIYKKRENGLLERKTIRKRPGTVGICAAIINKYQVDAVPHLICGGFTKEETEYALIDLHFLGIENVLVLRGDSLKSDPYFIPEKNGHAYASELLKQVTDVGKGIYLDNDLENQAAMNFCIGVAAYPEKHFEAPNLETDLKYLKQKVEGGADYIVTQMFYDNQKFFEFEKKCREMGITVPIIPGIKPLSVPSQLVRLPSMFHIDIPQELVSAVNACKNAEQVREVGIQWTIQQSKELIQYGVPCLHYYSMGKSEAVRRIAEAVF